MQPMTYALVAMLSTGFLIGCSDGGGSGSNLDDQVTLPDESDIPDETVEENESDGTDSSETGFTGRRFWVQGDEDSNHPNPGLKAVPASDNSNIDTVDPDALAERQFFTVPATTTEGQLAPAGVFYRQENEFRFAPVTSSGGPDNAQRVSEEEAINETCIADLAFDTDDVNRTAIAFNRARAVDTNQCPSRFAQDTDWYQVLVGDSDTTPASSFDQRHVPVVPLNANDGNAPDWLVLDRSGPDPVLRRVSSANLSSPAEAVTTDDADGALEEVHRIAQLGPESFILAYGTPAEGDNEATYRLAHYNRADDTLSDLEAGSNLEDDTLARLPQSNWITTNDGKAYIGLGNGLLKADSQGYSLLDAVDGSGTPFFVIASDTHVVWGALSVVDGNESRLVRVIEQGGERGGTLVRAPYVESRVRGSANGWMYFTVARGVQEDGRLNTGFAIGINPDKSSNNAFILEDAQWIGSSIAPTTAMPPQDFSTAPITDLFFRSGSDDTMRTIKAVEDPDSPLVQVDGNTQLPTVTLGTLPEDFSAVFMGEGFGPQRLLTAVRVDDGEDLGGNEEIGPDELSISNRIYHLNPENPDSLGQKISEEDGALVRALPLF